MLGSIRISSFRSFIERFYGTKSFESLKPEVDKCILVCANCHREIHAGLIKI